MRKFFGVILFCAILVFEVLQVYAADLSELRVGLVSRFSNLAAITFANPALDIGFEQNGNFVQITHKTSAGGFVAVADSSFYVSAGQFGSFAEAYSHAITLRGMGHRAAPAVLGANSFAVYIGGFDNAAGAQGTVSALGGILVSPSNRRIALMDNNVIILVFDADFAPQFSSRDGIIDLGERRYRGRIELIRPAGQNLTAVNIIGIQEYLYSVVPSEMAPGWHDEALKAQAVASRSFTVTRRGAHANEGFDLCDTVHCQAYNGVSFETTRTTNAVRNTANLLIWHANQIVSATFFSSSGGHTDDSENVWTGTAPYLRAVLDFYEQNARVWYRVITLDDLNRALLAANANIGTATGMFVNQTANNRVQELIISGTMGNKSLTREQIRTFFAPIEGGSLASRNFTITSGGSGGFAYVFVSSGTTTIMSPAISDFFVHIQEGASQNAPGQVTAISSAGTAVLGHQGGITAPAGAFVLEGTGFGHGVGMSQHGAQGMALAGYNFIQILQFYYRGVEVR